MSMAVSVSFANEPFLVEAQYTNVEPLSVHSSGFPVDVSSTVRPLPVFPPNMVLTCRQCQAAFADRSIEMAFNNH